VVTHVRGPCPRQNLVNPVWPGVNRPLGGLKKAVFPVHGVVVTDFLFAVLLIATFAVLALTLRGLEKL